VSALGDVVVERLTRRFGRTLALRKVGASFPAGSCTLLRGGNGSGKSTLLSVLATRLRPTRGTVRYGDTPWEEAGPALRGRIGLLGHGPQLYRDLSGRENLRFFARLHGLTDVERRVDEALAAAGMTGAADRAVGRDSRGMVQRLALARALLHDPELLLLDEPFSGLDDAGAEGLRGTLAQARERGRTVVLATHAPDRVADLCDRVLVLERGAVAHAGPIEEGGW